MKKLLIALSAMLLLSGCATPFGMRLTPKAKPHVVAHQAVPLPVPAPVAVTPIATPTPAKPSHRIKWFH